MSPAKGTTSPAPQKEAPVILFDGRSNDLQMRVGENRAMTISRQYIFNRQVDYAKSIRERDIEDARILLDQFENWCKKNPAPQPAVAAAQKK